jgi:hypothetical protein
MEGPSGIPPYYTSVDSFSTVPSDDPFKEVEGMLRRGKPVLALCAALIIALPLTVIAADGFTDVPDSNIHHDDIAWLRDSGVTRGCNPPANTRYCPDQNVTRAQMASFLRRLAENQVVNAATAPGTLLSYDVLDVSCTSLNPLTSTYAKVADVGTFELVADDSLVKVTFNGRISVQSFSSGTGAVFELRVDDRESSQGRARASVKLAEAGNDGVAVVMSGFFPELGSGEHDVSIWARATISGSGNNCRGRSGLLGQRRCDHRGVLRPHAVRMGRVCGARHGSEGGVEASPGCRARGRPAVPGSATRQG